MRTTLLALVFVSLAACGGARPEEVAAQEASAAARSLGGALLTKLTEALEDGTPASAIGVCGDVAQRISYRVSEDQGFAVRRTALRVRNPENAPDDWERTVMEGWLAGEPKVTSARVETDDGPVLRWMSPIRLVGFCTQCHGDSDEIAAETRAAIAERYPSDQATGFAVGDLRGAFTVTVPLE